MLDQHVQTTLHTLEDNVTVGIHCQLKDYESIAGEIFRPLQEYKLFSGSILVSKSINHIVSFNHHHLHSHKDSPLLLHIEYKVHFTNNHGIHIIVSLHSQLIFYIIRFTTRHQLQKLKAVSPISCTVSFNLHHLHSHKRFIVATSR